MPAFINEVQLPLVSSGSWETISLSSYIPVNASVVFLKLYNSNGFSYDIWTRAYGSSDALVSAGGEGANLRDYTLAHNSCMVDPSTRQIQVYRSNTGCYVYLTGYLTTDEVVPFVNTASHYFQPAAGVWTTMDASTIMAAAGVGKAYAVLLHLAGVTQEEDGLAGVRPTGSSDTVGTTGASQSELGSIVCTLDNSNQFQVFSNSGYLGGPIKFYVVGFIIKDIVTFHTSAVNVTPSPLSTFVDQTALPSNAIAGFYVTGGSSSWAAYNVVGKGLVRTAPTGDQYGGFFLPAVPVGSNQIVQTYTSSAAVKIYELGYWHTPTSGQLFFGTNF